MTVQIRLANTTSDLEAIYRFRYTVYVEEMKRRQFYADHVSRTVIDPLDQNAFVLGAWEGHEVLGTVRNNFLRVADVGDYFDMYNISCLPSDLRSQTSITTRLMVASHHRNSTLAARIACAIYQFALERSITVDFIDCNDHLVDFFTGMGYVRHRDDLVHPEYGNVTVLRLNLTDIGHLERVRSPFSRILRKWTGQQTERQQLENCQRTENV